MHKCGSSTLQNVLMRYGDRHNLNFVLPWCSNVFSQTHLRLSMDLVKSFPVHDYNILCHHTRYSKEGFDSLLPVDSTYVTIIRDPTTLFESLYTYFRYDECFGVPLETFLENPQQYDRSHSFGDTDTGCYAKDSMLFELGLDDTEKADPKVIEEMINRTASEFELVMIMDYFSESLILLKELMCWDLEDVSYFVVNGRATSFINKLSDVTAERIRKWNNGNTELYRFFNETFWRKVKEFGEDRMREEVAKLEEVNRRMADRCVQKEILNAVWHPDGVDIKSYKVKDSARNDRDCQLITKGELAFTNYLRKKQLEKYFGLKLMDEL
nr:galactosylceramide sulfotransferase-like [Lytechinus pictus]